MWHFGVPLLEKRYINATYLIMKIVQSVAPLRVEAIRKYHFQIEMLYFSIIFKIALLTAASQDYPMISAIYGRFQQTDRAKETQRPATR